MAETEKIKYHVPLETQYIQWCEDFRALNEIFWRLPFMSITFTGGVAFGIGTLPISKTFVPFILFFVAVCNLFFIAVAWRLRSGVMELLLEKIRLAEQTAPKKSSFAVVWIFTVLFLVTSMLCFYAALNSKNIFVEKNEVQDLTKLNAEVSKVGEILVKPATK